MKTPTVYNVPTNDSSASRMLGNPNARVSLGMIFRKKLKNNNISDDDLLEKILDWRDAKFANTDISETQIHNTTESLKKAAAKDEMSWREFCDLMAVLGYDEITMLI
jgi:hypothetical protein